MNSDFDEALFVEIASQSHTSVENVRKTYQSILYDLRAKARIHDFIPLLAMNSVRKYFRDSMPEQLFISTRIELHKEQIATHMAAFEQNYAH